MKKFFALLLAVIMLVSVIPFAAAADHEHYDNNKNDVCDAPGCTEPVHSNHYDDNGNGVCDHPGCTEKVVTAHIHIDANGNGVCDAPGCTEPVDPSKPIGPGVDDDDDDDKRPGAVVDGKHIYTYRYSSNRHWLQCFCGEIKANSYADHKFNSKGECTVCDYEKWGWGYDCDYGYGDYRVYLSESGKGDTELSTRYADKGDTVYIYTDADYGYKVSRVEVETRYGTREITINKRSNGTYSFRMPSSDVYVTVKYTKGNSYGFDYGFDYDEAYYGNYKDVDSDAWYYSAVKYVTDREIMAGASYNKFAPSANLTRAALAEALYAIAGSPNAGRESFSDVDSYDSFYEAVAWCANKDIITGWNGKFMPNGDITREDLAVMLYRYADYKRYDTDDAADLSKFADADDVSAYAVEALEWAVAEGIINGTDKGLNPQGTTTRAEAAAMIMRFCKGVK